MCPLKAILGHCLQAHIRSYDYLGNIVFSDLLFIIEQGPHSVKLDVNLKTGKL